MNQNISIYLLFGKFVSKLNEILYDAPDTIRTQGFSINVGEKKNEEWHLQKAWRWNTNCMNSSKDKTGGWPLGRYQTPVPWLIVEAEGTELKVIEPGISGCQGSQEKKNEKIKEADGKEKKKKRRKKKKNFNSVIHKYSL